MIDHEQSFGMVLYEPQQGHTAISAQVWPYAKSQLVDGKRLWVSVQPLEDARSMAQNKFYWGVVLKQISEQAQEGGMGATADGWHLYYKRMLLGYAFTKTKLPGKKRPSITRELRSTTKLSVKQFAEYIEQVQAHAATTFGVEFSEMLPPELKPEERKRKANAKTVIDAETGEILAAA